MASINTNVASLVAQQSMQHQNDKVTDAMAKLSSGLRINSASDDAAGSAIASKMESQVRSLEVAIRNGHDAISMTQTAEGALGEMENILQRVRELTVQAGNSTLSAADRVSIQNEVTSLTAEIDNIADTTNFNGVKLLNGTNNSVSFQTGIDATDSLTVTLKDANVTNLGLGGSTGVSSYTSERISADDKSGTAVTDVKINGKNFLSATLATLASSTEAAGAVADAINLNTGVHGAVATAFNEVTSALTGSFVMSDVFELNGETIALSTSAEELVANINLLADGVQARLNANTTITLFNNDGGEIIIADAAGQGAADIGFTTATYEGFVKLENLDGSAVTVEAGNQANGYATTDTAAGLGSDVELFGFTQTTADGKGLKGNVVSTDVLADTDLVKINDVLIGASLLDSASSKADAINKLTSEHGVTANASSKMAIDLDFTVSAPGAAEWEVQGAVIDISGADNTKDVADLINADTGVGDVYATVSATGLLELSSASGQNIVVLSSESGFAITAEDGNDNALTAASNVFTAFGQITLSTVDGSSIKLTDGSGDSEITNTGLAKLGLQGTSAKQSVSEQGVDVSSLVSATNSLAKIDSAIDSLSEFRSSFGSVENRIDAQINNMTTLKVNTQAAQSRIEDADFAAETTNLTKAQILSQAATSMLAQANSSKQNLLALLQG
jgi:flagellin